MSSSEIENEKQRLIQILLEAKDSAIEEQEDEELEFSEDLVTSVELNLVDIDWLVSFLNEEIK